MVADHKGHCLSIAKFWLLKMKEMYARNKITVRKTGIITFKGSFAQYD